MVEMKGELTPETIREMFRDTREFKMKRYELGENETPTNVYLLYCDGMIRTQEINETVLPQLNKWIQEIDAMEKLDVKMNVQRIRKEDLIHQVFSGQLVIYFEKRALRDGSGQYPAAAAPRVKHGNGDQRA